MSSPVSLNVTGLDTETLIQELMKLEKRPMVALEAKQKLVADRRVAWNNLQSKLDSIMSKIKPLLGQTIYDAKVAKVGNLDVVSATASETAAPGKYDIDVIALAQSHTLQSRVFTQGPDEGLGLSGTLSFTIAGEFAGEITVEGGENADSLNSIAAKINEAEDLGISASVLQVNSSEYTLVLKTKSTGKQVLVEDSGLLGLTTVVDSGLAEFKINGITFKRDSNSISDAIPGLSLNLLSAGKTSVTVDYDNDAVVEAVNQFVSEYNSLLDMAAKYDAWDSDTRQAGLLFGDPLLQRLLTQVRQTIFREISDKFPGFRFVGAIGISTGRLGSYSRQGKLSLDEAKFRDALTANRDAVMSLLRDDEEGSQGVLVSLQQVLQMYTAHNGFLPIRDAQLESQDKDIARQIDNLERRLQIRLMNLRRQFTALETLLTQMKSQGLWLAQQVQGMFTG